MEDKRVCESSWEMGRHSRGCSVNFLLPLIAAQLEGRQAVTWEAGCNLGGRESCGLWRE